MKKKNTPTPNQKGVIEKIHLVYYDRRTGKLFRIQDTETPPLSYVQPEKGNYTLFAKDYRSDRTYLEAKLSPSEQTFQDYKFFDYLLKKHTGLELRLHFSNVPLNTVEKAKSGDPHAIKKLDDLLPGLAANDPAIAKHIERWKADTKARDKKTRKEAFRRLRIIDGIPTDSRSGGKLSTDDIKAGIIEVLKRAYLDCVMIYELKKIIKKNTRSAPERRRRLIEIVPELAGSWLKQEWREKLLAEYIDSRNAIFARDVVHEISIDLLGIGIRNAIEKLPLFKENLVQQRKAARTVAQERFKALFNRA